jgi:hypothetical protein
METEKIKNDDEKKESLKKTLDELLYQLEQDEQLLKQLQEKFAKQKKEIRKWLHWMG